MTEEFASFCKKNNIRHTFMSPYDPATNDLAEKDLQTFKRASTAANFYTTNNVKAKLPHVLNYKKTFRTSKKERKLFIAQAQTRITTKKQGNNNRKLYM